jgi:hypothetical protein
MEYLFNTPESKLYGLTIFISIVLFQVAYILLQWMYIRRMEYIYYAIYMVSSVCVRRIRERAFFSGFYPLRP